MLSSPVGSKVEPRMQTADVRSIFASLKPHLVTPPGFVLLKF